MKLPQPLIEGTFISRANRFACWVKAPKQVLAHLPNSGRLHDLLVVGRRVYLHPAPDSGRKTPYDLLLVSLGDQLVSVDARLPSALVEEALRARALAPFRDYTQLQREVFLGRKRLDFLLRQDGRECFLEVKSVTLVEGGVGLFPDAPTLRGREHLQALLQARQAGKGAAVAFIIQRRDAVAFSPRDATDPAFGQALRQAFRGGVQTHAFRCFVSREEVRITQEIPVHL